MVTLRGVVVLGVLIGHGHDLVRLVLGPLMLVPGAFEFAVWLVVGPVAPVVTVAPAAMLHHHAKPDQA